MVKSYISQTGLPLWTLGRLSCNRSFDTQCNQLSFLLQLDPAHDLEHSLVQRWLRTEPTATVRV